MSRRIDDRLTGAWIPDPDQPDADRWASMEISPAGWLRFIVLDGGEIERHERDYSVPQDGTLEVREDSGKVTRQVYQLEEPGPVLVLDGRRFVRVIDPTARPWPAAASSPDAVPEPPSEPEPLTGA